VLVQAAEDDIALDHAGLLIAAVAQPGLDVVRAMARFDELAAGCEEPSLDALRRHLYGVEGFRGNAEDYYDPRNSYLDQVLERRLGIPITLAVVLMEVGRRLGLVIRGLNTPGHFLVQAGDAVLDPFAGAAEVHPTLLPPGPLEAAGPRMILARMLANLKQVFLDRGDVGNLRWVLELRTSIPGVPDAERDELRRLLAQLN
jgi:regulator of sirC expression with transglutaminase-like and TPR domain